MHQTRHFLVAAAVPLIAACASGRGPSADGLEFRERAAAEGKVLVIAREPGSGLTIWDRVPEVEPGAIERFLRVDTYPNSAAVAASSDRIVRITGGRTALLVHESRQRYPSLDAAEAAIECMTTLPGTVRYVVVPFGDHFAPDYFDRRDVSIAFGPRLTDLRPAGDGNWTLTLTGNNGRVATITLDAEYRITSVEKDRS